MLDQSSVCVADDASVDLEGRKPRLRKMRRQRLFVHN